MAVPEFPVPELSVPELTFRAGTADDTDWLLGLFDGAITWLLARGQPGQWGSQPFSGSEPIRRLIADVCGAGGLRVASLDGAEIAALVVGEHPPHVPAIDRPELYIDLLLVSRAHAGRRIGEALVERALAEAREAGAEIVRVDCWAGAPSLVVWYEARGFTRSFQFTMNGNWTAQVFELEL